MVNFSIFLITFIVLLSITSFVYLLSVVDVMATENINSKNISYSRHVLGFPEISWITGKFHDPDRNENAGNKSSHTRQTLLVVQTIDGNIHTLDVAATDILHFLQSTTYSNISTFKVNASVDTGGPVITDLNDDNNYEIMSTTSNGSLAVINYGNIEMGLYNNTKLSPRTQIVLYFDNLKGESMLLGISEDGTLLMLKPTIMNNDNVSSNTFKFAFEVLKTNFTNLLTDGRIVIDNIDINDNNSGNEVLVLTDPVDSYPHGALGDILEPTKLLLLERCHDNNSKTSIGLCLKEVLKPPEDMEVFETIKPVIIEYVNGTKTSKGIDLVVSSKNVGSAAYVYNDISSIQFSSKPIGQGFRWLLILGAAMVNNNQSMLVINETPHLSGILKFIDIINNKTLIIDGFSAHDYGSKNIGMYAIADLDNDWQEDLIIPTLNKKKIAILYIFGNNDTIYANEHLELMDKLTSNIIVMDINYDGYEDIIAGDRSGNVYIFTSQVKYKNQEII